MLGNLITASLNLKMTSALIRHFECKLVLYFPLLKYQGIFTPELYFKLRKREPLIFVFQFYCEFVKSKNKPVGLHKNYRKCS